MMQFELPQERPSIIKVIGVGGGGSNAVNYMYKLGIKGVDFLVCNTDLQALEISPVPMKIQLGPSLTEGRGAGAIPEVGKHAAIENIDEIRTMLLKNTKMVFITAGMGGGTGTGAAPIIAGLARELGILTVAIVTVPFSFEGQKRKMQAEKGIEELKKHVDTLLVICNDKLREIHGDLKLSKAFGYADDVLAVAAKSIAEIITRTLHINVDFADVQTVMKDSGVAIMGAGIAEGENRAMSAVKMALDSPLLNDNEIQGARYILLNITSGTEELSMDEMGEINEFVQQQAGQTAEVIMGIGYDESLGSKVNVTIIATGFKTRDQLSTVIVKEEPRILYDLSGELISNSHPVNIVEPEAEVEISNEPTPVSEISPELSDEMFSFFKPLAVDAPVEKWPVTPSPVVNVSHHLKEVPQTIYELHRVEHVTEASNNINEPEIVKQADEPRIMHFLGLEEDVQTVESCETPALDSASVMESVSRDCDIDNSVSQTEISDDDNRFVFELDSKLNIMKDTGAPQHNEIVSEPAAQPEPVDEMVASASDSRVIEEEDPFRKAKERLASLREMSFKINTPNGLSDLEKEPAYKRRNVILDNIPPSGESNISRFTLTQDKDNKPEIKGNNPFLHDRVD